MLLVWSAVMCVFVKVVEKRVNVVSLVRLPDAARGANVARYILFQQLGNGFCEFDQVM